MPWAEWRAVRATCQTDEAGRRLNREALVRAGYRYAESVVQYDAPLTVDDMVGGVFSALSADQLPSASGRAAFTAEVRDALAGTIVRAHEVWVALMLAVTQVTLASPYADTTAGAHRSQGAS
ncbi:hypothetical protein [Micromonospora sp. NPDC000442]|uniref:hypothetical protein n=1 Tax=Micromonospora sp. NPDC000442 TaxID=3364217 RepID=UPI0036B440FD